MVNACYLQGAPKHVKPSNAEVSNPEPGGRRLHLSVQIPPKPVGLDTSRSGKGYVHPQNSCKGSSSSSSGGLLRVLSFKKKGVVPDSERSFLINSDHTTVPESPVMANLRSAWQRCTSLPVTPASNLSPAVSTPISARMPSESHKASVSYAIAFLLPVKDFKHKFQFILIFSKGLPELFSDFNKVNC